MAEKMFDKIATALVLVGGLNWGLAVMNVNLVQMLLGTIPSAVNIAYGAIGASALYIGYNTYMK